MRCLFYSKFPFVTHFFYFLKDFRPCHMSNPPPKGMHNLHLRVKPGAHPYFVTKDGAPFVSYCQNPEKAFPARWTRIPSVKRPVTGIRAPRIRVGPREVEEDPVRLEALQTVTGQELIPELNLTHQSLGDTYQFVALKTFLRLNSRVTVLCLGDNELFTLEGIELPDTVTLHLSRNAFCSFEAIPALPSLTTLYLMNNFISDTTGLSKAKYPLLQRLTLKGNPITQKENYVNSVMDAVSALKFLDERPLMK